ncbi:MAG TPA: peptide-methionine (S)-S-oxide reductase MsrA [Chitinophagaceae bacterium]|nr:peptide-methionine (S)-S-oxide reductase MsrA [Chitinophagaceae bacterium]
MTANLKVNSMNAVLSFAFTAMTAFSSCAQNPQASTNLKNNNNTAMNNTSAITSQEKPQNTTATDTATFANGCFWCTEAIFEQLDGVISATSGYTGGTVANPTYKQVCTGETGHAEALQIVYDPKKISFDELLEVFWETHDPTTLNRQGNDVGTQYRSGIFYHNEEQKQKAEKYKEKLDKSGAFDNPVVTEITPFTRFYTAENYHQQYFENNEGANPYCKIVIRPKVDKFRKVFKDKLKDHQ